MHGADAVLSSPQLGAKAQLPSQQQQQKECFTCRVIGSTSLGAVGLYALNQSRAHQPGSVVGKRIMAAVGICFLAASYVRWNPASLAEVKVMR